MPLQKIKKTLNEWKKILPKNVYAVTREAQTEPPFTGKYYNHKEDGIYHCVCCKTPLFDSQTKFDSQTGWPSFYAPIDKNVIKEQIDYSHAMVRTEVLCNVCDAHLGHSFLDGPPPTYTRYCINSICLDFQPRSTK